MKHLSYKVLLSSLCLGLLLFDARLAQACSCGPKGTALEAYEGATNIVITRAVSVDRSGKRTGAGGVSSTKMMVERVYKGRLRVGDEITFSQGGGADCVWTFDERSIGREFLFYLGPPEKGGRVWIAWGCGRSTGLQFATDDLLYLNNLDTVRGRTRISGTVSFEKDTEFGVAGRTIRIVGEHKTSTVKTDKDGVYEIYDLPAGKYWIEPETPAGWKIDHFWLVHSSSFAGNEEEEAPKRIPIILKAGKHATLDLHFEIDNAIRGHIYDNAGHPMEHVCVKALRARSPNDRNFPLDCTDREGAFAITEVPRGSYVLAVNDDGKVSSSQPFHTFYYPNAQERERAAVITIGPGDMLEGFNIHIRRMEETVTIDGLFLYADGKPVRAESVQFKAAQRKEGFNGDARVKTDAQGRFRIKILKGFKGALYGEIFTYLGEYENCPKLDRLIKKDGSQVATIRTPAVEIEAEKNIEGVELRYSFPGCRRARTISRK